MSMIEKLGLVEAVNRIVTKRHQGLTPGIHVALGMVAKLCAPATSWNTFGDWLQKTILPEYWNLPPSLLDAQNFWDHWDHLCSESTITRTSDLRLRRRSGRRCKTTSTFGWKKCYMMQRTVTHLSMTPRLPMWSNGTRAYSASAHSTVQQQICDILGLAQDEPSRTSATVPLHTIKG